MPWGLIAGYHLYGKSKKRQQKPAPLNASQQSLLDFLKASKTTNLSDKDTSLLVSTDTIQYGSEGDEYLGPAFNESSDDYVEVLIYDTQDNFLESGVVDKSDYFYDEEEEGIKIKTGTVLRKMGYDRGRFKVLYNFLRKMAGSYETLVTDTNGNVVNGDIDESEINKSLFIKENKYPIHEISDSRTELRLISQNIRDENYLRRFYKLGSNETKYQSDETPISNIEFVGMDAESKANSKELKFVGVTGMGNDGVFDETMKGGKIIIPNFFVTRKIPNKVPSTNDNFENTSETIDGDDIFSSFRTVGVQTGTHIRNDNNQYGELFHGYYHQVFGGLSKDDIIVDPQTNTPITEEYGHSNAGNSGEARYQVGVYLVHIHGLSKDIGDGTSTIKNIYSVERQIYPQMWITKQGTVATIDLESTSTFESDSAVDYEWTVFGWDEGRSHSELHEARRKEDSAGNDIGGDIKIVNGSDIGDSRYAEESTDGGGLVATKRVQPGDFDRSEYSENSRPGCRLRINCYSNKFQLGVQLKVKDNSRNRSAVTALPCIYKIF